MPAELDLPADGRRSGPDDRVAWSIRGSYAELARALERLRAGGPVDRRLCGQLVGEATAGRWPLTAGAMEGAEFVARRMPARIVVSGDVIAAWRARGERAEQIRGPMRDHRLRTLAAEGVPIRELARRSGLSERQVQRIAYRAT